MVTRKESPGESSRQHVCRGDFIAKAYSGLGDHAQAFDWLEHAYNERTNWVAAERRFLQNRLLLFQ